MLMESRFILMLMESKFILMLMESKVYTYVDGTEMYYTFWS